MVLTQSPGCYCYNQKHSFEPVQICLHKLQVWKIIFTDKRQETATYYSSSFWQGLCTGYISLLVVLQALKPTLNAWQMETWVTGWDTQEKGIFLIAWSKIPSKLEPNPPLQYQPSCAVRILPTSDLSLGLPFCATLLLKEHHHMPQNENAKPEQQKQIKELVRVILHFNNH